MPYQYERSSLLMDRILVTEPIADEGLAALRKAAQVDFRPELDKDKAQLLEVLPEYDALVVRSGTKVTAEVLEAGAKLRVVGRAGTGVDNIDVDAATRRGIVVVNAPASNSVAVAELTIGLILSLARQIPQAHTLLQSGKWERNKFMGFEVRGKTLGLVGLGGIVDEAALIDALERRLIAGAAIDVFAKEPPIDSPLLGHPRVITLPHLGASTVEAQALTGVDVAEGVIDALKGSTPRYAVNAPFVAPEEWNVLSPYIRLGRQLGVLCTALIKDPVRSYELEYRGELADVATAPVRMALLQGLLEDACEQRVTPVNAPLLARERGLRYSEHSSAQAESYAGLLVLRAVTADGMHEFAGTVLRDEPHIVEADGYWVDFVPSGPLMFTYHRDRPGMIGRVGMLLGAADVNISGMYVGRLAPREQAMMVLTLDDVVPANVLAQIQSEEDIQRAVGVVL